MTVLFVAAALVCLVRPAGPLVRTVEPHLDREPVTTTTHRSRSEIVGAAIRSRFGRPANPVRDVWLIRRLALALGGSLLSLSFGAVIFVATAAAPVIEQRRAARRIELELAASLAEVVDLFTVALHGGLNVVQATRQVSLWAEGPIGEGLRWCCIQVDQGSRLADSLEALPERLGEPVRPLVSVLVSNERYGAPILQTLAMLAADARASRRRRAETAARRLPVAMLFPLVLCVLPAFLLLTVVPVVARSISALPL